MARYHKKKMSNKRFHKYHNKPKREFSFAKNFYKFKKFVLKHPLISSMGSIILSIYIFKIKTSVAEFKLLIILLAFLLSLTGFMILSIWFLKKVKQFER